MIARAPPYTRRVLRLVPWLPPLFRDRADAGRVLARSLVELELAQPVVVGVARGGVVVALEVARALSAPLTAVSSKLIDVGGARLGAVTAGAPPYIREGREVDDAAVVPARRAAEALAAQLDHEPVPVAGRDAIVVDDGLVTGLTLASACVWARSREAARVIAATPVGRSDGLERLRGEADAVACPHPLDELAVVGQAYDSFEPLDEWYVAGLLSAAEQPAE
jgi:predicted phosphoribosyltransferase